MSIVVPDVGEVELLKRVLYANAGSENWTLKLFKNNITPAEGDTAGTYTEADFTGYSAKTITSSQSGATWGVPATSTGTTSSTYGTNQTWTNSGSAQTIYGWYMIGATSTTLLMAEAFTNPINLTTSSTLTITPALQLA